MGATIAAIVGQNAALTLENSGCDYKCSDLFNNCPELYYIILILFLTVLLVCIIVLLKIH